MRTLGLILLPCFLWACATESKPKQVPKSVEKAAPPSIRVHPESKGYVYRYFPVNERKPKTAKSIDKVPTTSRDMVLVVPDDVEAPAGSVYVADLRKANADGTFPYRVVSAADLDRTLDETRETPEAPKAASEATVASGQPQSKSNKSLGAADKVIMFSASWCGVCRQARRWFENKGIPFEEKDIEKDPGARQQMVTLAEKANFDKSRLTGVPVIWVKGRMLSGFSPQPIERILQSK